MARVVMFIRIMPMDSEVNLDELAERIKKGLPEEFKIVSTGREPIGFGMESLIIGVSVPEEEGVTDKLEEYLRSIDGVGEIQVEALGRE